MSSEIETPYVVAVKMWKIYNVKIKVVSFVIETGRKMTISVKIEVNVTKRGNVKMSRNIIVKCRNK